MPDTQSRRPSAEVRVHMLDVSQKLLQRKGFDATSTREISIAERAIAARKARA
jgi:AcrR family transcriptional regulator